MTKRLSRRAFLGLAAGASLTAGAMVLIDRAYTVDPGSSGSLADIDHFVLLMQENRSFDHYFGTMSDVLGFDDHVATFAQRGEPGTRNDALLPFPLGRPRGSRFDDLILADPDHSWTAQHAVWNRGAMDAWLEVHRRTDGAALAPSVMGYYTRTDLPVHYALADAFTVCDQYFSSVLGPTAPNRLYWTTGTLDPEGEAGGPVISPARARPVGSLSWRTYAENLTDAGVSWKMYNSLRPHRRSEITGMLKYFRNFQAAEGELPSRGLAPRWPSDFVRDVHEGTLPAVSWVIPPGIKSEHPLHPPAAGAEGIMSVLGILLRNPAVWERTAVIVSYDENGGFFDHVAPPVAPPSTPGEAVRRPGLGSPEPIGLGFRVPCLVLSPYTRGGLVASETYDHTSQLRLLEARFGVPVPNLSTWRRAIAGDMTRLFGPRAGGGRLDLPSSGAVDALADTAVTALRLEEHEIVNDVADPLADRLPRQELTPKRRRI